MTRHEKIQAIFDDDSLDDDGKISAYRSFAESERLAAVRADENKTVVSGGLSK